MNANRIFSEAEPAGYEKIRKFVLGRISTAGANSRKLASNRELAKLFGVSQPTVARALKALIEDGFLSVKTGVGVFTNPAMSSWGEGAKLVGMLYCDGRNAFLSRMANEFCYRFSAALMKRSSRIALQNCFLSGSQENAGEEIFDEHGLDAIAWIMPGREAAASLKKLKEAGKAVAVLGDEQDGASCSYFDYELHGFEMAELLLAEGRRKIVLSLAEGAKFKELLIAGVARAFSLRGLSFASDMIFVETPESKSSFIPFLASRKPDGLIFSNSPAPHWKALKETLDISSGCRLCAPGIFVYDDMEYEGYLANPDFAKGASLAVESLLAQLDGRPEPKPERVDVKLDFAKREVGR